MPKNPHLCRYLYLPLLPINPFSTLLTDKKGSKHNSFCVPGLLNVMVVVCSSKDPAKVSGLTVTV